MIYLDNSATTFIKPKSIQRMISNALNTYTANPGRSGHKESIKTALAVESVRELLASYVNTSSDKIIFTLNCTDALNAAILGTHKKSGNVVCTINEHNSVLRPLHHLKQTDPEFSFSIAEQTCDRGIVWEDIEKCLQENTYLVITNHISNVNGDTADIEKIGIELQKRNILFLVDGAQGGGHFKYDMKKMGINLLTFAGHKGFYSPQGVGCLCLNGEFDISPIRFGGTGTNSLELSMPTSLPERLEAGTLNTPAILGFGEGVRFVKDNYSQIESKTEDLITYLHYELSKLPVNIYTAIENTNGVFAFNVADVHSQDVANYLDEKWNICVRGGYHCAPLKHKALKTLNQGAVRVSISLFNTYQEIEKLIFAIKNFIKNTLN